MPRAQGPAVPGVGLEPGCRSLVVEGAGRGLGGSRSRGAGGERGEAARWVLGT